MKRSTARALSVLAHKDMPTPVEREFRDPLPRPCPPLDPHELADDPEFRQWAWEERRQIPRVGWP